MKASTNPCLSFCLLHVQAWSAILGILGTISKCSFHTALVEGVLMCVQSSVTRLLSVLGITCEWEVWCTFPVCPTELEEWIHSCAGTPAWGE